MIVFSFAGVCFSSRQWKSRLRRPIETCIITNEHVNESPLRGCPGCLYVFVDTPFSTVNESVAEAADLKEERLQELESCSGVGSTSDDTEVREVSSRPSTPGLSVVSGTHTQTPNCINAFK